MTSLEMISLLKVAIIEDEALLLEAMRDLLDDLYDVKAFS